MNRDLTIAELDAEGAELLPTREALGFINIACVTASNSSLAANVLTAGSSASSAALQGISVTQG